MVIPSLQRTCLIRTLGVDSKEKRDALHAEFESYLEGREGLGEDYKLLIVRVDEMLNLAQQEGAEEK